MIWPSRTNLKKCLNMTVGDAGILGEGLTRLKVHFLPVGRRLMMSGARK
jgi:hypothetical protein